MAGELEQSWKDELSPELNSDYMLQLRSFLKKEQAEGKKIYPGNSQIFNAFAHTAFQKVKIVILGQDPYHGANQAHGLSFSVQKGVVFPPSLMNIFKELQNEIPNYKYPANGDLTYWANQGVLLLNAVLTVEAGKPGSHQKKGWEKFTDNVIVQLSKKRQGLIFLLWGNYAKEKSALIDQNKHFILSSTHPSPFSAHNGFFGCNHFIEANAILQKHKLGEIDWQIT